MRRDAGGAGHASLMRADLIFAPFARFAARSLRQAIPSVHIARDPSVRLLGKVKGSATRAVIDGKPSSNCQSDVASCRNRNV